MPVKAGKQMAKTLLKLSGEAIREVRLRPSGRISRGPLPTKKATSDKPSTAQTTQRARTPRSAPLVSMSKSMRTVLGMLTQRASTGYPYVSAAHS